MKIKKGFILKKISDSYIVVAVGPAVKDFNGAINLNEVGATLFEELQNGSTIDGLVKKITDVYDVDTVKAKTDAENFVKKLMEANLLEQGD